MAAAGCVAGDSPSLAENAYAIARMAVLMQQHCSRSTAPDGTAMKQRLGLHVGPAVCGVVGDTSLRHQLFGPLRTNVTTLEQSCDDGGGGILASATFRDALGPFTANFVFTAGPAVELIDAHGGATRSEATWQLSWSGPDAELRAGRTPAVWPQQGGPGEEDGSNLNTLGEDGDRVSRWSMERRAAPVAPVPEGEEQQQEEGGENLAQSQAQ